MTSPCSSTTTARSRESYRVRATPTTFVIGRDGRLVARAAGTREWEGPAGRALLDALVAAPAK